MYTGDDELATFTKTFWVRAPAVEIDHVSDWVWDPTPQGNNDKVANPGERVYPRVRLVIETIATARNVRATLVIDDPDVEVISGLATYDTIPGEAGRNVTDFAVDISPTASAHDITAIVSVTAENGGPWQFTYTIPIIASPPEIAQRADWIWDPAPGGNADRVVNPGESVRWALRLKNTGGPAQNAVASIVINDDEVTVVRGTVSFAEWGAKEAKTNVFLLDIAPDTAAHDISATVSVTADSGGPWQFDISTPIAVQAGAATALLANFPNPFNPETWIPFDLSEDAETTVRIYDTAGRQVRRLDLGWLPAGAYRRRTTAAYWDGRNDIGERASSGVYIYELRAGAHREIRRMTVRK